MKIGIIGGGPIGIHMAYKLSAANIANIVIEKGQIGQSIANWPSHSRFHSAPDKIVVGNLSNVSIGYERNTRDEYLAHLRTVTQVSHLNIQTFEEVTDICPFAKGFRVATLDLFGQMQTYYFSHIVIATGSCHASFIPRVPGIDSPIVKDITLPLHSIFQREVLIIGGRHSALEYALKSYWAGARSISIISKSDPFLADHLKHEIIEDIGRLIDKKKIHLYTPAVVQKIEKDLVYVMMNLLEQSLILHAHWIVIACGYTTSQKLLLRTGIEMTEDTNAPVINAHTNETSVKGCYIIGTAVAGQQQSQYKFFIENTRHHAELVLADILSKTGKANYSV